MTLFGKKPGDTTTDIFTKSVLPTPDDTLLMDGYWILYIQILCDGKYY